MSNLPSASATEPKKAKKSKVKGEDGSNKRPYTDDHDESQPKKSKKVKREAQSVDIDSPLSGDHQAKTDLLYRKEKKKKKKSKSEVVDLGHEGVAHSVQRDTIKDENADAAGSQTDLPATIEAGPSNRSQHNSSRSGKADFEVKAQIIADASGLNTSRNKKKKKKKRGPEVANESLEDAQAGVGINGVETEDFHGVQPIGSGKEMLEKRTPFVQHTASFYLTLSPCAYNFPLEGVCAEHLSPLLLTYYPPLQGIVLNYSNVRLSEVLDETTKAGVNRVLSKSINEYGVSFVWLTADFTIFRPRRGTRLEGYVNLQNESLLGLVCYNFFNASIERARLPPDWQWIGDKSDMSDDRKDGAGYFVDGQGKKVEGKLTFSAKDFDATPSTENGGGTINIVGTMLSRAQDKELDA
nr:dna-directed rna polymerase i subunit rpa43 [Quercus suber]